MATGNARSNSSRRPRWASDTTVAVTVVPMLAPITIGTALASGSGCSGAATSATIIEVVTDELWTSVVASRPARRPTSGFSVAAKKLPIRSSPSSLNPEPSPLTPIRNTNSSSSAVATRGSSVGVGPSGRRAGVGKQAHYMRAERPGSAARARASPVL